MLAGRIGGLRCGGPLFDWQRLRVEMPVILYHPPSHGKGMPEGQGVGRRRKRAKPTSGATRHLLPEEGGRSGMSSPSTPFLWKGDARRAGGWPKENCTCQQKLDTKLKKLGIKIEYLYKIQ